MLRALGLLIGCRRKRTTLQVVNTRTNRSPARTSVQDKKVVEYRGSFCFGLSRQVGCLVTQPFAALTEKLRALKTLGSSSLLGSAARRHSANEEEPALAIQAREREI